MSATSNSRPKLEIKNVAKSFGGRKVVRDVSLTIRSGEVIGLLGPNGAGKTTTFYMVVGLLEPDEGNVLLEGESITNLPLFERARKGIGYLPQEASVFRKLTVEQNILAVLERRDLTREEQSQRLEELLGKFGITHIRKSYGIQLSGGERRRVEIARALALEPKFLLFDEPFAGIDPLAVNEIQEVVRGLKSEGIGILITDHNVRETLGICDQGFILKDGEVGVSGTPEEIASNPVAREVYLGENFRL